MSKRAEEKALKAYPEEMGMFYEADIHYEADLNKAARIRYIEGYEQAEKDIVEMMIDWLDKNWRNYIIGPDADGCIGFGHWKNDFRKAMEEE